MMKIVICNLKNGLDKRKNSVFSDELLNIKNSDIELVIAPSIPFISFYDGFGYKLGSQDISSFTDSNITGEIVGEQLVSLGCKYVIVGHSDRRINNNEININFINKINNAQECGLKIIYCIGESLSDRENNNHFNVLEQQISEVLNNVDSKNIVIAYEPAFTKNDDRNLNRDEIVETIQYIKDITFDKYEINYKVIYGGKIDKGLLEDLKDIKIINGYLIDNDDSQTNTIKDLLSTFDSQK